MSSTLSHTTWTERLFQYLTIKNTQKQSSWLYILLWFTFIPSPLLPCFFFTKQSSRCRLVVSIPRVLCSCSTRFSKIEIIKLLECKTHAMTYHPRSLCYHSLYSLQFLPVHPRINNTNACISNWTKIQMREISVDRKTKRIKFVKWSI